MFVSLLMVLGTLAVDPKESAYPRPELLIEVSALTQPEARAKVRLLDVRPREKYADGHLPGAVWVDPETWARTFKSNTEPATWSKLIGALGIDHDTEVVIYDDAMSKDAARVWWILRYWGLKKVRLLNGGWMAWTGAKAATSNASVKIAAREINLVPDRSRLAVKEDLLGALKGKTPQIVDARSEKEHCGEADTARRNGAIPGARHLEWSDLLDKKSHKFKSAPELTRLFKDAGIDPTLPTTTYCQSGGRAAVMAFTLELMGGKEIRNYYQSWAEWGNDDKTPIVKPTRPNK